MGDVKACRICLATNVVLHNVQTNSLELYYSLLIGVNPLAKSALTMFVCYECRALLTKFYVFRQKSLRGQAALQGIFECQGKLTLKAIQKVSRDEILLNSNLSIHHNNHDESAQAIEEANIKTVLEDTDNIKVEVEEFPEFEVPIGDSFSDHWPSDDEPLSLHKMKQQKLLDDKDNFADVENETIDTEKTNDKPPSKRKPRRPKAVNKRDQDKLKTVMNWPKGTPDDEVILDNYVTVRTLTEDEQRAELNLRRDTDNYKNAPFKCEHCFKGFLDSVTWKHHAQKHDPSAGDIECVICKVRFKSKRTMWKHITSHEKKYMCNFCPYISKHTTQAKQHVRWHQGVLYKCPYCDEMLSKWTSYLSHVRIKHPSDFICGFCGYSFVSKLGLAMHKSMMHKDEKDTTEENKEAPYCDTCDVKFASNAAYKRHMATAVKHIQSSENKEGCRECGESFKTHAELRAHIRCGHGRKFARKQSARKQDPRTWPSPCPHCSEMIPNARMFYSHFRRFHRDKPYPIKKDHICDVCGKTFRGNAFLKYHKRTHSQEKLFKCSDCGKAFFNRGNLQMHEKTHSEQRPYVCCVCGKGFKMKGALDRHFRSHTGDKPYKCEVCDKAFGQSNSCKMHVRTVHLKQPSPYISRSRLDRRNKHRLLTEPMHGDTLAADTPEHAHSYVN
ncbi:zinc finger protein 569-like [Leptidea sinapis]|uniref:zinc finger protein 569-like n=1 Tax=Leptidea sinapis TaxID=189913 RepID=UPI002145E15D|nr:zinc finger protein 569-like [Leptidea sinapis]